jgi:hypothetical protein
MKTIPDKFTRDYESDDTNRRIQEAYERMLNPMLTEDSTEDAKKTLDAIIGATKDDGGDVHKMAMGMKKSYEKNKGFSKEQAQWIYKTSQALFKK